MTRAAIIGTGLIGRGWAVVFARAGWQVRLWDRDPEAARAGRDAAAAMLDDPDAAGLLDLAPDLAVALDGARHAQESVPEDIAIKRAVFARMDAAAAPDCILASSASAIPGAAIFADLPGRARCIVAHPANPPHLLPAVEIVPSAWHSDAQVAAAAERMRAVGQVPVIIRKEVPGFVMNRLQAAVVNEAMALVSAGVVSPGDLDAVMSGSLGPRWALMGPFETMDLNAPSGFRDYAARYGDSYRSLGAGPSDAWPDATLDRIEAARRAAVPSAALPDRQAWRDAGLARISKLKRDLNGGSETS